MKKALYGMLKASILYYKKFKIKSSLTLNQTVLYYLRQSLEGQWMENTGWRGKFVKCGLLRSARCLNAKGPTSIIAAGL